MKRTSLRNCLLILSILLCTKASFGQGVAVNTSNLPADTSAMLDVASTTKGMLIPRLTNAQIGMIVLPAPGLLVYQKDGAVGYYYNAGTAATPVWRPVGYMPGAAAGSYGSGTQVPVLTLDAYGRVTGATTTAVTTGVTGTTNYLPVFSSSTTLGNSIIYENPAAGNRIGVNYGTINHGLVAIKATSDTEAVYINQSGTPTIYGDMRLEYTGGTDANRVGILTTTIRSVSDVNGTGLEGAGCSIGVQGLGESSSTASGGQVEGLEGDSYGSGTYSVGVNGSSSNYIGNAANSYGVYGYASGGTTNYGVYSDGNMRVNGTLSKSAGTFEIDHPLDPANKYLYHSFVESPDMMNIYNGNITTDATGTATVTMPGYFDALNKDFRYQLTVMGTTFAQALVSKEMTGNTFEIKTNQPDIKVSWQVTGVRQDAYANAHRVVPEVEKKADEKGKYLHPELFGQSDEAKIGSLKHINRKDDPAVISHGDRPAAQK